MLLLDLALSFVHHLSQLVLELDGLSAILVVLVLGLALLRVLIACILRQKALLHLFEADLKALFE